MGRPTQADFSCETPFLEITRRLDAASLPLALLQLYCSASSLAPWWRWPWGAVHQGPSERVASGSSVPAAGSPTSSSATKQPISGEDENVVLKGPASLHELPNMAAHREKLRAIHAADDITDNGCQYARRC